MDVAQLGTSAPAQGSGRANQQSTAPESVNPPPLNIPRDTIVCVELPDRGKQRFASP